MFSYIKEFLNKRIPPSISEQGDLPFLRHPCRTEWPPESGNMEYRPWCPAHRTPSGSPLCTCLTSLRACTSLGGPCGPREKRSLSVCTSICGSLRCRNRDGVPLDVSPFVPGREHRLPTPRPRVFGTPLSFSLEETLRQSNL